MERVAIQLKKRVDKIDFRKIYKGFYKTPFLIEKDGVLYGIEKTYPLMENEKHNDYVIKNKEYFAVIEVNDIDYDKMVINLVEKMFKIYQLNKSNIGLIDEIKLLVTNFDYKFYEEQCQLNLILAKILKGKINYLGILKKTLEMRIKNNRIYKLLLEYEKEQGLEKYVHIMTTKQVSDVMYNSELISLISLLEDPLKVFEPFKYAKVVGAALLIVENLHKYTRLSYENIFIPKTILNFNLLFEDYEKQNKKLIMYKLSHARKIKMEGRLLKCNTPDAIKCNSLLYLSQEVTYLQNHLVKIRKGDFVIKVNEHCEIAEAYECLNLKELLS